MANEAVAEMPIAKERKSAKKSKPNSLKNRYMSFFTQHFNKQPVKVRLAEGMRQEREVEKGSVLTEIPKIDDPNIEEIEFYSINEPYTYARIIYNEEKSEYVYHGIEPQLTFREKELLSFLKETLKMTLAYDWEEMSEKDRSEYLEENLKALIRSRALKMNPVTEDRLRYYILRDFIGYGPIDVLLQDENVEDTSCDGVDIPIFIFHKKFESIKTSVVFEDEDELNSFVILLGQRCGRQVSVSQPILDGTSIEGHRVQATYSNEITTRGATFTIRRFKEKPFTPVDLLDFHSASPEMVAYLWIAVEHGESMIIAGGTASGKTATLNALMLFIPPTAKIVSIEDTREINLPHENWIPGVTRTGAGQIGAGGKAAGAVDMYDLVRAALRQRPNYIMVGEVRGKETYTMFQAMATGHTTYATMHADSVKSMVHRLENPPINCPRILLSALNNVLIQKHARVGSSVVRRIMELVEIVGFEPETNELITNTVFEWDQATDSFLYKGHSFLYDKIQEMKGLTSDEMREEVERRVDIIDYMIKKHMVDFREVGSLVSSYYKEPEVAYERIKKEVAKMDELEAQRAAVEAGRKGGKVVA
ncbi:MAG: type II/IV secretion system ATPase subunit [Thermoplasmata archaeon]